MGYRVVVVGATGNVGREMLNVLAEREFPADEVAAVTGAPPGSDGTAASKTAAENKVAKRMTRLGPQTEKGAPAWPGRPYGVCSVSGLGLSPALFSLLRPA